MPKKSSKRRRNAVRQLEQPIKKSTEQTTVGQPVQDRDLFLRAVENINMHEVHKDKQRSESQVSTTSSAKSSNQQWSIDLHGMTVSQAQAYIDQRFHQWMSTHSRQNLRIRVITGKGLHSSAQRGVLAEAIHSYILRMYREAIVEIEASPHEVQLSGMPIRGHFDVVLKFR